MAIVAHLVTRFPRALRWVRSPFCSEVSSSGTRRINASRAGSGSGRCGTSDSQVPGCPREASRRCRQEQHRPPDSLRCRGTPHERNGAKAGQDDTSGNAHACDRTEVAVLPWRDYALHAGSRGRCPPPAQTFRSGVVNRFVHRDASRRLWCPATPITYQNDITFGGLSPQRRAPGALASGFDRLCSVRLVGAGTCRGRSVSRVALAPSRRDALGRALDGDLCAARECPARGGRPGRFSCSRSSGCVAAGAACLRCGRADLVAAPRPEGSRPAGRGRPPAPKSASCPRPRLA